MGWFQDNVPIWVRPEILKQLNDRKLTWNKTRLDEVIAEMLRIIPANNGNLISIHDDLDFLHRFRKEYESKHDKRAAKA